MIKIFCKALGVMSWASDVVVSKAYFMFHTSRPTLKLSPINTSLSLLFASLAMLPISCCGILTPLWR